MKYILVIFVFLYCLIGYAQTPNWQWANSSGGTNSDNASGITTNNIGDSFVCGYYFSNPLIIGTNTLTNNGNYDFYIAKYNNSGVVQWALSYGGIYDDNAIAITHDNLGNVYVAGYFVSPTLVCGTTTLVNSGATDMFIMKIDFSGNLIWAKNVGNGGNNQVNSIATDMNGNVFVAGAFNNSTINFGSHVLTGNGNDDIFVAKMDVSGNWVWAKNFGGNLSDVAYGICVDAASKIFVTGYFKSGSLAVGTSTLINASVSSADLFLIKLDNSGNISSATSVGNSFDEIGYGITCDIANNVILTGSFFSPSLTVGTTTLINNGNRDILVLKFDNNCGSLWSKAGGGSFDDYGYGITSDVTGVIYVNGHNHSVLSTYGTQTLSMNGVGDGVLVAYNANGAELWVDGFGGGNDDGWNAVSTDGAGNIYCAGYFSSNTVSIGSSTLNLNGTSDLVVAKISIALDVLNTNELVENNFMVFPNPSSGLINIKSKIQNEQDVIQIYNSLGQIIFSGNNYQGELELNLSSCPKGVYFVLYYTSDSTNSKKFIIH